jgi:hypothetical protein
MSWRRAGDGCAVWGRRARSGGCVAGEFAAERCAPSTP